MALRYTLEEQLTLHEGRRKRIYRDSVGKMSGGVGRNLDDVGLSDDEIDLMLRNDIARAKDALDRKHAWWRGLDDVRQKVLVDMMFNLGPGTFGTFTQTLGEVARGEYAAAAARMLKSKWARQVGKRAKRLAEMMRTGRDYE